MLGDRFKPVNNNFILKKSLHDIDEMATMYRNGEIEDTDTVFTKVFEDVYIREKKFNAELILYILLRMVKEFF